MIKLRGIIKGIIAMSKQSEANSDNWNSLQADTPGNAKRKNNNQLIEMAVEQFASLLLKHSTLKKSLKGTQNKATLSINDKLR